MLVALMVLLVLLVVALALWARDITRLRVLRTELATVLARAYVAAQRRFRAECDAHLYTDGHLPLPRNARLRGAVVRVLARKEGQT